MPRYGPSGILSGLSGWVITVPDSLVTTKFYIPPVRADAVPRPRLLRKLVGGVGQPQRLTLIAGPAGSGKTTLLSQFAAQFPKLVVWLSLDDGDNQPSRFWTYLITACQTALEGVGDAALVLLDELQTLPVETIPTILINDLAQHDQVFVLVLDDYHVIHEPSIHEGMSILLDFLPASMRVVLSTRIDPPWPLPRFRARNRLIEIRAQDLRFSRDETGEFLRRTISMDLAADDLAALEERTEGWAAGLQLAALALQSPPTSQEGRRDASEFVQEFAGSHVFVAEYLVEEVLKRQPEDMRTFLLQTSILERLSGELCGAVTNRQDGRAVLDALRRANLFVIPLDDVGRWYRYHHLFADLLRAHLSQTQPGNVLTTLHRRAANWYDRHGLAVDAIRHALAANDLDHVAALVDRVGQTMIFTDQYKSLQEWLEVLPKDSFRMYPRLEIYRVLLELGKGTLDMSEQTLQEKEALIRALPSSPENDSLRLEALVYLTHFLAFQNAPRAIAIAQQALPEIPEENLKRRAYLYSALYRAYGMQGNVDEAERAYVESLRLAQAAGHFGMIANTTMIRAFDLCQYGRLDEAARYCQEIIEAASRIGQQASIPAGPAYIGLAGVLLERNDLEAAEANLTRGLDLCRQGGMYGLFTGYAQRARLYQAKGMFSQALEDLDLVERLFQRREFTLMARLVSIRLATGDVAAATELVGPVLAMIGDSAFAQQLPLVAQEALMLCLARIFIAQGELEQAATTLDQIQATVKPGKRFGRLMEVYLLRALLLQKEHAGYSSPAATASLERALELGEPAGYVMLFLEEGLDVIPLLHAVASRGATAIRLKRYVRMLLEAFGEEGAAGAPRAVDGLIEPLTPREMEVLQLLAAGHSNKTIADRLVITVRTVKKHTGNIYGKLDVRRRTQAVARARELGLLPLDG